LDPAPRQKALVKREAALLCAVVGPLNTQSQELWDNVSAVILNREWNEGHARVFVCWAAGADQNTVDAEGNDSTYLFFDDFGAHMSAFQLLKFSFPRPSMFGLPQNMSNILYSGSIDVSS
jgi:hypothetical protein